MTSKDKIISYMNENGYKILNPDEIVNTHSKVKYICKCDNEKYQIYKDLVRRECRKCNEDKLKTIPDKIIIDESGEEWRPILGGWISNFGNCKNIFGKILTLCPTKYRYSIGGKNYYASRLVATAFKIENYEKIENQSYVVHHIDGNQLNNNLNNLKIISKNELGKLNSSNYTHTNRFGVKTNWEPNKFDDIEYRVVPELINHKIYINGEIKNEDRFLIFSQVEDYFMFITNSKPYKVHRLICYAFHPIEGKKCFEDYKDLQVNHKDGNKLNNHSDNLEWTIQSVNMQHAYNTGLNKKVRNVYQTDENGNIIKEFISIANASRETGEKEENIRSCCKGKRYTTCKYYWKFKNPEETDEYSKKYSKF